MGKTEQKPSSIYIVPDLLEEIFIRLPLKPILRFKTLSKQWRSVLESRRFAEMRVRFQKNHRKILVAGDQPTESQFEGDEEVEVVSLHCDDATRPSLTCDGLVCIPLQDSINILNPTTGESLTFPSGSDSVTVSFYKGLFRNEYWYNIFPGHHAMGFGKDKVDGSYKVVRMFFNPSESSSLYIFHCEILDVNIGEWRKLVNPPPCIVEARRKSACVNGSIYWLIEFKMDWVLALDLHTEEFRKLPPPPTSTFGDQVVNLEDRLAIATKSTSFDIDFTLRIWCLDAQEESWSKIYSISLSHLLPLGEWKVWFRPVAVSKQGNLFFYDNRKRLYKYYPEKDKLCCLSSDICVISPFVENLVRLRPLSSSPKTFGDRSGIHSPEHAPSSPIPKIFRLRIPNIFLTTALVSLVIFRYFVVSSKS